MNELIKQISPQQMIRRATRLPVTGQTTSYRTGDDGDVKAGKARRFQKVGNLVYDWSTMLCWVANPAAIIPGDPIGVAATAGGVWTAAAAIVGGYTYGDLVQGDGSPDAKFYVCILEHTEAHEPPNATYWVETPWTASAANLTTPATMDWNDAIDQCLALNYGGFGGWSANNPYGWRLPNMIELLSIIKQGGSEGSYGIYSEFTAPSSASAIYMSSTTRAKVTDRMMTFNCVNDIVPSGALYKTSPYCVRPVRSLII